jgi:hypothetical protein
MSAVSNLAVLCSSLILCFLGVLLRYFLNDSNMVPVTPIAIGIIFDFKFYMLSVYIVRSLHFRIFSTSVFITFLSPEMATSINVLVPYH